MVFSGSFNRNSDYFPMRSPIHFPRKFTRSSKRGNFPFVTATDRPFYQGGFTLIRNLFAVPSKNFCGSKLATILTNYLEGKPSGFFFLATAYFLINILNFFCIIQCYTYDFIKL